MKRLKVAVCFSGLPRFSPAQLDLWYERVIRPYNAQVFVHTWCPPGTPCDGIFASLRPNIIPRMMSVQPITEFDTSIYTDRVWPHRSSPQNVISMWYSVQRSIALALAHAEDQHWEWDIIIRARWDWQLDQFSIVNDGRLHVPNNPQLAGHVFNWRGEQKTAHNDQFAYGKSMPTLTIIFLVYIKMRMLIFVVNYCSLLIYCTIIFQ